MPQFTYTARSTNGELKSATIDAPNRDEVIKQQCALKWPHNFQMQAVCIEEQVQGRESLSRPVDPHVSPEEHAKLRAHCEKKWPDDAGLL